MNFKASKILGTDDPDDFSTNPSHQYSISSHSSTSICREIDRIGVSRKAPSAILRLQAFKNSLSGVWTDGAHSQTRQQSRLEAPYTRLDSHKLIVGTGNSRKSGASSLEPDNTLPSRRSATRVVSRPPKADRLLGIYTGREELCVSRVTGCDNDLDFLSEDGDDDEEVQDEEESTNSSLLSRLDAMHSKTAAYAPSYRGSVEHLAPVNHVLFRLISNRNPDATFKFLNPLPPAQLPATTASIQSICHTVLVTSRHIYSHGPILCGRKLSSASSGTLAGWDLDDFDEAEADDHIDESEALAMNKTVDYYLGIFPTLATSLADGKESTNLYVRETWRRARTLDIDFILSSCNWQKQM